MGVLPTIVIVEKYRRRAELLDRRFVGLSFIECLILFIFTTIAGLAVCFHEPWSDEAQAWLIARDLGIGGILHQMGYEGSPPLWHLLLWVLARLHLPYALLGFVSLFLVAAGMYIWLRWSPLPESVRWLVPFAFYYQYQYAVVTRSYALSTLLAFGAAALWRTKPVRVIPFGLVLALLAQTNMHGFMIAGGISCAFGWECIQDFRKQRPSSARILQTSIAALIVLVSAAIARTLAKPFPDCSFKAAIRFRKGTTLASITSALDGLPKLGAALGLNMTWGLGLLLIFVIWFIAIKRRTFVLPSIATLAVAYQMNPLKTASFEIVGSVLLLILVLAWFFAVKQLACALPLLFTALAMGLVWARPWHYGMALTAFLVSVWGAWPSERLPKFESPTRILEISLAVLLILQLPLTAKTVWDDVRGAYSGARATAEFLRPYVGRRPIYCMNFYGTGVQPYFDRNIFVDWPTAFWTWSSRSVSESNRILYGSPSSSAIIIVPSGGQPNPKFTIPKIDRGQLAKRHFLKKHEFCGAQFWMGRVSEYECYEIYEKQSR